MTGVKTESLPQPEQMSIMTRIQPFRFRVFPLHLLDSGEPQEQQTAITSKENAGKKNLNVIIYLNLPPKSTDKC